MEAEVRAHWHTYQVFVSLEGLVGKTEESVCGACGPGEVFRCGCGLLEGINITVDRVCRFLSIA